MPAATFCSNASERHHREDLERLRLAVVTVRYAAVTIEGLAEGSAGTEPGMAIHDLHNRLLDALQDAEAEVRWNSEECDEAPGLVAA